MRVTVLGASPVRPNPGQACTGYLLDAGPRRYLLDAGSGVIGQLLQHARLETLDAVFLSHAHPDHCLDLICLRQSMAYGPDAPRESPLPVYASRDAIGVLEALGAVFEPEGFWSGWVVWHALEASSQLRLDDLAIRFHSTRHYRECLAMRFEQSGRCLVFGADGGPQASLAEFASGADLLIAEATLDRRERQPDAWGHLSAYEAGLLAATAGAKRLLLTHYFESDGGDLLLDAARQACAIPVELAREGAVLDV